MEEREIHESYQLLLAEYHKRVKQRTKQKLAVVASLMNKSSMSSNETNTNNNDANDNEGNKSDIKLNPWQPRGSRAPQNHGKQGIFRYVKRSFQKQVILDKQFEFSLNLFIFSENKDAQRLSKSRSATNLNKKQTNQSNPENGPLKIEVTIPKVAPNSGESTTKITNDDGDGPTNFRNKVKLFQTKTMLSSAFGESGAERFAARKMRMESNLNQNGSKIHI